MNPVLWLIGVTLAIAAVAVGVCHTFGRFGRNSKLNIWKSLEINGVPVLIVYLKERRGSNIRTIRDEFEKANLAFANEETMKVLAGSELAIGIGISSEISPGRLMILHWYERKKAETTFGNHPPAGIHEYFAAVDLLAVRDTDEENLPTVSPKSTSAV